MLRFRSSLLLKTVPRSLNNLKRASSAQSSSVSSKQTDESVVHSSRASADGSVAQAAKSGKLQARFPLVKNFFVGVVDKQLLAYPEVISRDDMSELQNEILPYRNFFAEKLDVTPTVLDNVRQLGLYGINVPTDNDGKGWGYSESLIASEAEANCVDVALSLLSHRVIVDALKEVGTKEQQQRFLSKLAKGSLIGAEAIFEFNVSEDDFFNTSAEYDNETNSWTLNGEKAFVVASPLASDQKPLFLVIAQTQQLNLKGDIGRDFTLFLVDSNTPGVSLGEKHATIGCRTVKMHHLKFDKVKVSADCVLGKPQEGSKITDLILRTSRLRHSIVALGLAKNLVNDLTQYIINNKQTGVNLKDCETMQFTLSNAVCAVYSMESMLYFTAGIMDEFQGQDATLEAAITKYFSLTQLLSLVNKMVDIIGPKSLHEGQSSELVYRNAAQLYSHGESINSLRLYIPLSGLQHAGTIMQDSVKKVRNPLFNPGSIFSKFMDTSSIDNPKTKMRLNEHLHPTLEPAAQCLEHSVARLQMSVELLFTYYGAEITDRHNEMQRLTEMSTWIYAMFASMARASRSYCIGLHLSDHEMLTALAIASRGHDVVKVLCTEIFDGQYANADSMMRRLSTQVLKSKGYFPVHPLTFNF